MLRNLTLQSDFRSGATIIHKTGDETDEGPLFLFESNEYLLQNYTTVIMDLYTSTGTTMGRGFLVTYTAGKFILTWSVMLEIQQVFKVVRTRVMSGRLDSLGDVELQMWRFILLNLPHASTLTLQSISA